MVSEPPLLAKRLAGHVALAPSGCCLQIRRARLFECLEQKNFPVFRDRSAALGTAPDRTLDEAEPALTQPALSRERRAVRCAELAACCDKSLAPCASERTRREPEAACASGATS